MFQSIFKNKTVNFEKLPSFGFVQKGKTYSYAENIVDEQFTLTVEINLQGKIKTKLTDINTDDEYILHLTSDATGAFIGKVRTEYLNILQKICDKCFESQVFKSAEAIRIIQYVQERYGDDLEFLWEKFPENAIFRRKDNSKWYAALLCLPQKKLGLSGDELIEIIDLRCNPKTIEILIDKKKYFPGFHMNKKHWITICLNGSVPIEEILSRIDDSYILALK